MTRDTADPHPRTLSPGGAGPEGGSITAVLILAGGTGERLGGVSKADVRAGGVRLLDHAFASLEQAGVDAPVVVIGPPEIDLGRHEAVLTREDPPLGGPAAGIGAGLAALPADLPADALIGICTVDAPLTPRLFPQLLVAFAARDGLDGTEPDGAVPVSSDEEAFPQFPQGIYRFEALRSREWPHNSGVRRIFREMRTVPVVDTDRLTLDVDTPSDLVELQTMLRARE